MLDQRRPTLLVIDDVWHEEQLQRFLEGARRCVRLITTRYPELLPRDALGVLVNQVSDQQATDVLTPDLPPIERRLVARAPRRDRTPAAAAAAR